MVAKLMRRDAIRAAMASAVGATGVREAAKRRPFLNDRGYTRAV